MSIVCTLEPKVNLFKGAATKNLLVLKNNTVKSTLNTTTTDTLKNYNNNGNIALSKDKTFSVKNNNNFEHSHLTHPLQHHHLQLQHHQQLQQHQSHEQKPRISVVEFVSRQHSNDTNLSAELLNCSRFVAAMPEVLSVATSNSNNINNNHKHKLTTLGATTANTSTTSLNKNTNMNNVRMSSISPSLSMNGSSNEATNVHGLNMYGPMSPQSSDSGHSLSDSMTHMNGNGSKYYDNMTKQQQHQHHKELFSQRKQREFTPDNKKDDSYWDRRRRNNEAAKRSREKRRYNDMVLEQRVVELTKENHVLKAQLDAIRDKFNISGENLVSVEQILASLPTSEQVLSITKRAKIAPSTTPNNFNAGPAVAPTNVSSAMSYAPPAPATTNAASSVSNASANAPASPQKPNNLSQAVAAQEAAQQVIKTVGHPHIPTSLASHPHDHHMQLTPPPHVQQYQHHAAHVDNGYGMPPHVMSPAGPTTTAQMQLAGAPPPPQSNLQNLHVLQALNRNVSSDDLDNLRKVVAVVGAITTAGNPTAVELPPLYGGASHYGPPPPPQSAPTLYGYAKEALPTQDHNMSSYLPSTEATVSSSAGESVTSSCLGGNTAAGSVLNLSRRACSPTYEHILSSTTSNSSPSSRLSSSLSSASSSGAISGDDEHDATDDVDVEHNNMVHISTTSPSSTDSNNCLPLKLRHKSHLGDKDAAATALLALQHIKQEPISNRASPPAWGDNGDNSSDERDSGISIASAEWTAQFQRKVVSTTPKPMAESTTLAGGVLPAEREHLLKSKLARLESEVASIKNMMILSTDPACATPELKI